MTVLEFSKTAPDASEKRPSTALSVKNVLFPTDFSPTSESALPYAVAIARRFGSTLHLVHVLSEANLLMMSGGVDYVSMGTIYEDAHVEAREKLEQKPHECAAFAVKCTPENPLGAPMVSSEGACAAYYHYGRRQNVQPELSGPASR